MMRVRESARGDSRGVDGNPAPAPLLCDVGGGARTAGGVEDKVARIGGHQDTAFDYSLMSLNNIDLFRSKTTNASIEPSRAHRKIGCIFKKPYISWSFSRYELLDPLSFSLSIPTRFDFHPPFFGAGIKAPSSRNGKIVVSLPV